jgi:hypothetical protein
MSKFKISFSIALKALIASATTMAISLYLNLLYLPRPSIFNVTTNPNPPVLWVRVFISWLVLLLVLVGIVSLISKFTSKSSSNETSQEPTNTEKPIIAAWLIFTLVALPISLLTIRITNYFSPSLRSHVSYSLTEAVNYDDNITMLWLLLIADKTQTQILIPQAMQASSASCLKTLFTLGMKPKKERFPTLMLQAVAAGNDNLIKVLLEEGVSVNFQTSYGQTPLLTAVEQNRSETVNLLLASGANVNISTKDSYPLLVIALLNENTAMMQTLIKAGLDVKGCKLGKEFSLVRKDSPDKKNPQIIKLEADSPILLLAAVSANVEAVKILIAAGVDVNQANSSNLTALMCAKASLCSQCEEALVAAGAK